MSPGVFHFSSPSFINTTNWWLAGGTIPAINCIAAYQPKEAASYAASKVNLANPGVLDAVDGTAFPTWTTGIGWTFTAASSQYLKTGIKPTDNYSAIVRFSNASGVYVLARGDASTNDLLAIRPVFVAQRQYRWGNTIFSGGVNTTSGVMAVTTNYGYLNGVPDIVITSAMATTLITAIAIGAGEFTTNTFGNFFGGNVQAVAIYDTTLSDAQIAALSVLMAAL